MPDYVSGSGYRITPVLSVVRPGFDLALNRDEVDAAFEVPLSFLMDPANHTRGSRFWGDQRMVLLRHALWRPAHLGRDRRHHPHALRKALCVSGAVTLPAGRLAERSRTCSACCAALSEGGEQARVAGGAVRNALLGQPVADIDIATTTLARETIRRGEAAGFKAVPTGIEHGTITLIAAGRPYEVTTLRADVETDGRRAKVRFGRDWKADAERRDFTINGLYAEADGTVIDLVGGVADIETRTIRFIGDAGTSASARTICASCASSGSSPGTAQGRPDADGLKACARLKDGLDALVGRAGVGRVEEAACRRPIRRGRCLWMRQAGVLSRVLPESEKWGIDAIHALVAARNAISAGRPIRCCGWRRSSRPMRRAWRRWRNGCGCRRSKRRASPIGR